MSEHYRTKKTTIERGVRFDKNNNRTSNFESDDSQTLESMRSMAIETVKQKREHEKQALGQLNDRFAKYIERVKFLESQNKILLEELEEIREKWGEDTRVVKEQFEPELSEARATIDDIFFEKATSEIKSKRAEYEAVNSKRLYDECLTTNQADNIKISNLQYLFQVDT